MILDTVVYGNVTLFNLLMVIEILIIAVVIAKGVAINLRRSLITNYVAHVARRVEYVVGIRYSDDADKAIEIIKNLSEVHPLTLKNPPPDVFVDHLGDNSVNNIIVRIWVPTTEWYGVKMELLWKIKKALEREGIQIPFPQREVWFNNELKSREIKNSKLIGMKRYSNYGVIQMIRIPKCMSTQHPDNVNSPFFARNTELGGEDEIQEAYYAFSHLGCDEQMWDCEGKEVDNFVVKKLLTKYESFFREKRLGRDVFITLRVPNPTVEKAEAKILLETLESVPRSFDAAKLFYQDDTPPIFEVILPMTASPKCLDRIYRYYCDFVVGKQNKPFREGDITIAEWIGEFKPERINVIPLFEDMEHMLDAHNMTREYLQERKTGSPQEIDEERCLEIIRKYSQEYQKQIIELAPVINKVARHVPSRRKRKLHIGLFGYSRSIGGITLPRAIAFTAALYSIGLPPEILGLNALNEDDLQFIREVYVYFEDDLRDSLRYFNPDTGFLAKGLEARVRDFPADFQSDEEHKEITDYIAGSLKENKTEGLGEYVLRAANLGKFLG